MMEANTTVVSLCTCMHLLLGLPKDNTYIYIYTYLVPYEAHGRGLRIFANQDIFKLRCQASPQ